MPARFAGLFFARAQECLARCKLPVDNVANMMFTQSIGAHPAPGESEMGKTLLTPPGLLAFAVMCGSLLNLLRVAA